MIWTTVNYVSTSIPMCGFCLLYYCSSNSYTEDGVPYIVSIFAENSAGNGTKCNVTDFTDELGESWYTYNQCVYYTIAVR